MAQWFTRLDHCLKGIYTDASAVTSFQNKLHAFNTLTLEVPRQHGP
jgi:hypothetical protein